MTIPGTVTEAAREVPGDAPEVAVNPEPREVEACLVAIPGVRDAAVIGRRGHDGESHLAAYVVPGPDLPDIASLMRMADKTMQAVKREGGGVRLYEPDSNDGDGSV